jgi:thiol-disulfide isomerase/thioredoxin
MKNKFSCVLIPLSLLACNFITGQGNAPLATPPKPVSVQSTGPALEPYSTTSFTISRIKIQNGDLFTQLAKETQKANALGQIPFIEFDAAWCPPCQAIEASIKSEDPLTMMAFEGIYLIRADVDEWGWGDGKQFKFEAIPVYYKLDDQGYPTGATVDGGAWNEDIPENFAPVLDIFFHAP